MKVTLQQIGTCLFACKLQHLALGVKMLFTFQNVLKILLPGSISVLAVLLLMCYTCTAACERDVAILRLFSC